MSSSRVFITKQQPIIVGHVCSCCSNPNLSIVLIMAETQKTVSLSQSKAEKMAKDTAEQAIQSEIDRIRECQRTHAALGNNPNAHVHMIEAGLFCGSLINGISAPCPNCNHMEPWQLITASFDQMENLTKDNFPIVFMHHEESQNWALSIIADKVYAIEDERNNLLRIQQSKTEAINLYTTLLALKQQKESLTELSQKETLRKTQLDALNEKKGVKFTAFKAKEAISAKIKAINEQIDELDGSLRKKQSDIDVQILSIQRQLQAVQPVAYGCTGKASIVERSKAFCFIVEANRIPVDVIERIRTRINPVKGIQKAEIYYEEEMLPDYSFQEKQQQTIQQFCSKCGFQLLPDSEFCSRCGNKLL